MLITLFLTLVPFLPRVASVLHGALQEAVQETGPGRAARVEPDLEALRRELGEVRVSLAADRAYAQAEGRLAALRERLVTRSDADGKALLAELDFLAADVARALGRGTPDQVDQAALKAIENNDWAFVAQLGPRAIPALAEAVRRNPELMPGNHADDPLYHLTRLAILETDRLASELLDGGGFFWKQRLLRALVRVDFGTHEEAWAGGGPPWTLRTRGIGAALERYLLDPDVQAQALDLVSGLEQRGLRFAAFERSLESALRTTGRTRELAEQAVRRVADERPSFIEGLLEDPDPLLRRLAVSLLAHGDGSTPWYRAATDADPRVRREVARALSEGGSWPAFPPAAFLGLLRDEDPEARALAWRLLDKQYLVDERVELPVAERLPEMNGWARRAHVELPLRSEDLLQLTGEPERRSLARVAPGLAAPVCFRILEDLARDPDPGVLLAVARALRGSPWFEAPLAYVAVLDGLWRNEHAPADARDPKLVQQVGSRSGVQALLPWLVARRDGQVLAVTLARSRAAPLGALEPDLAMAAIALAHEADPAALEQLLLRDLGQELAGDARFLEALVGLAGEPERALDLRLLALEVVTRQEALPERREAVAPALFRALREQGWKPERQGAIERVLRGLPDATVNGIVAEWVREPGFPLREGSSLVKGFRREGPGAKEVVQAVIEVGQRDPAQGDRALAAVLDAMGRVAALRDPAFLERMALGTNGYLAREALQAIGESSDARYLPLLVSLVSDPAEPLAFEHATKALFHYLDEEAVEPLLLAAKRAEPELRDRCIAHLETIREYQDARERWATHRARRQTREQVIAQLTAQLDAQDLEIRIQAIRALATWEAVEAMPRLIELSASGSNAVAAAAKQALDRLNAPRGE